MTIAGWLLIAVGVLNVLQLLVFLALPPVARMAGAPEEFVRIASVAPLIQVPYGVVRIGAGIAVLTDRRWARPLGIFIAILQSIGVAVLAAIVWNLDLGLGDAFEVMGTRAFLVLIVAIFVVVDAGVIYGLARKTPSRRGR